jgi:hypothetical protein
MLGLTHRSHYEHWTRDSICEKAALVGVAPSFCPPPVLATRLATKETFFVAPAPVSWLRKAGIEQAPVETQVGEPTVDGKPVGVVNRVWAKRRPTWDYLGRRQRIKVGVAAMPGGTRAEWKLYEKFFAAIDGYRRPHFRKRDPKPRKNDPLGLRRYDFDRLARDWTAKVVELYSDRPADTVRALIGLAGDTSLIA